MYSTSEWDLTEAGKQTMVNDKGNFRLLAIISSYVLQTSDDGKSVFVEIDGEKKILLTKKEEESAE